MKQRSLSSADRARQRMIDRAEVGTQDSRTDDAERASQIRDSVLEEFAEHRDSKSRKHGNAAKARERMIDRMGGN